LSGFNIGLARGVYIDNRFEIPIGRNLKMKVDNALYPISDQIDALRNDSSPEPIVMLNLLKFRTRAQYSDGRKTDLTGEQAYDIYIEEMRKIVERGGGKFLFDSTVKYLTIGEVEGLWDRAALVQYPSAAEFLKITSSPEAAAIRTHRSAGLEGQLLVCVSQRRLP
jgi:uncharacterized protein (DUF1330 family)